MPNPVGSLASPDGAAGADDKLLRAECLTGWDSRWSSPATSRPTSMPLFPDGNVTKVCASSSRSPESNTRYKPVPICVGPVGISPPVGPAGLATTADEASTDVDFYRYLKIFPDMPTRFDTTATAPDIRASPPESGVP